MNLIRVTRLAGVYTTVRYSEAIEWSLFLEECRNLPSFFGAFGLWRTFPLRLWLYSIKRYKTTSMNRTCFFGDDFALEGWLELVVFSTIFMVKAFRGYILSVSGHWNFEYILVPRSLERHQTVSFNKITYYIPDFEVACPKVRSLNCLPKHPIFRSLVSY